MGHLTKTIFRGMPHTIHTKDMLMSRAEFDLALFFLTIFWNNFGEE